MEHHASGKMSVKHPPLSFCTKNPNLTPFSRKADAVLSIGNRTDTLVYYLHGPNLPISASAKLGLLAELVNQDVCTALYSGS